MCWLLFRGSLSSSLSSAQAPKIQGSGAGTGPLNTLILEGDLLALVLGRCWSRRQLRPQRLISGALV